MLADLVKQLVMDDSGRLSDADHVLPAVDAAIARYSRHRPREVVADLAGNDSANLDLPDDWEDEVSRPLRVEYPVDSIPETYLDRSDWGLYHSPTGWVLRLYTVTPVSGESVRLTYTATRSEATVPAADLDAVAHLAAARCCEVLANLFAQTSDPTILADVVQYRSKSSEFAARAKRLREIYHHHIGADADDSVAAASTTAHPPEQEHVRLTHGRRR